MPLYRYIVCTVAVIASIAVMSGCATKENPVKSYSSGIDHYESGNYEEALDDFDEAIGIKPDYAAAYTAKGMTLLKLYRYEDALEAFRKVADMGLEDPDAYYWYGLAYDKLGMRDEAVEQYKKSLSIAPNFWPALNGMGYTNFYLGRYPEALTYFSMALMFSGNSRPKIQSARGYVLLASGEAEQAVASFEEALESDPGSRKFRLLYALGLMERDAEGDREEAEEILDGLLREDDSDITASHAYALLGRKDESLALLSSLADEDPNLRYEAAGRLEYREYRDDPEFLAIVRE